MGKPYQIQSQKAVLKFRQWVAGQSPVVQLMLPLANVVAMLQEGVGMKTKMIHLLTRFLFFTISTWFFRWSAITIPATVLAEFGLLAYLFAVRLSYPNLLTFESWEATIPQSQDTGDSSSILEDAVLGKKGEILGEQGRRK